MNFITLNYLTAKDVRPSMYVAIGLAAALTIAVIITTGQIYGPGEAKELLSSMLKSSLYFASAVLGASSTVLALTLTALSFAGYNKGSKNKDIFTCLHAVAGLCVYAFIASVLLMLVVSFPIKELKDVPQEFYRYLFYVVCVWDGIIAAEAMGIILVLRHVVIQMIGQVSESYNDEGEEQ